MEPTNEARCGCAYCDSNNGGSLDHLGGYDGEVILRVWETFKMLAAMGGRIWMLYGWQMLELCSLWNFVLGPCMETGKSMAWHYGIHLARWLSQRGSFNLRRDSLKLHEPFCAPT